MRLAREEEIIQKENDATSTKFGADGELFKKQEAHQTIQNLFEEYAEQGRYNIIFDKSSDLLMLYADENLDKVKNPDQLDVINSTNVKSSQFSNCANMLQLV